MTRGIFIAGNESTLLSAVGSEAERRVKTYALARISPVSGEAPPIRPRAGHGAYLDWNPGSPVSARTLVLAAQNKLEHIDEAILVCIPPAYRRLPEGIAPAEIDRLIDCNIKSWFFLIRELTSVFRSRNNGTLVLALQETSAGSGDDPDFIGPAAAASFRALAQGLLLSSANAPYAVMGFSASKPGGESSFAAHIFRIMEEGKRNSGKWHKSGKFSLFGG